MIRLCGALVTPLRLAGSLLLAAGLITVGSRNDAQWPLYAALGTGLLVLARVFRDLRWPPLPRYLRDPANQTPRHWHRDDERSDANVTWSVVRGVVEPWIQARRNPLHRGATRRENLAALSTGSTTRHAPHDRVALRDLAGPCDVLTGRLSREELLVARREGVLPAWFWDDLAGTAGTLS